MILVDTSIWIELLAGRAKHPTADDLAGFVTCGPIVQGVFQGLRPVREKEAVQEAFLAVPRLGDPLPLRLFVEAASIYSEGRGRGLTIRSSIDCLIAAIAIENRIPVWHRDRDFPAIARFTRLTLAQVN